MPPYPYMVKGRSGQWYHGYRCDMNICDELCHATPELRQIFGPEDSENAASFRLVSWPLVRWSEVCLLQVMGYAVGSNTDLCGTSPELLEQLSQVTLSRSSLFSRCLVLQVRRSIPTQLFLESTRCTRSPCCPVRPCLFILTFQSFTG